MAMAMVSPSARPRPSTVAPMMPERTHGSVTLFATSQSVMPSADAPSLGSGGTCAKRSRVVEAMIGTIISASTMPAASRPSPPPTGCLKYRSIGTSGTLLAMIGKTLLASQGPKVRMPHRPMTTLGMPARISMVKPSGFEIHVGIRSVRAKAAPMESGTAMTMAMSEETSVPQMMAQAPNCAPCGWATPLVWTMAP